MIRRSVAVGLLMLGIAGCGGIAYVTHVGLGELRILLDREALTPERRARLSEAERRALAHIEDTRRLAESIGLKASSSYHDLIERKPGSRVSVLVASPFDRLEALTWWFPIVGHVAYRGYFNEARARRFATELRQQGFDTYLRPALLYSTLGWFDDPIPRDLLALDPVDIVDVILHELVHETVYVKGNTAYNEGLATFIAHHATPLAFAEDPAAQAEIERTQADERVFAELLQALRSELVRLYRSTREEAAIRDQRRRIFEHYQKEAFASLPWKTKRYFGFRTEGLSNAYLLANQTYLGGWPCFEAELRDLQGDLRAFVHAHRKKPGHTFHDPACTPDG